MISIINSLLSNIENSEERELVAFGLRRLVKMTISILAIGIIGAIWGVALYLYIFMGTFACLRVFAGGFHMKTELSCGIISSLFVVGNAMLIRFMPSEFYSNVGLLIFTLILSALIWIICPVENANKRLYVSEQKKFRWITRIILLFELSLCTLAFCYNSIFFVILSISIISVGILVSMQKIINERG
ncbi:MAG: accessory gene regulator B family protein [Lachnospiraceae bacterium]|nr:accessory gene regulator B family protein [Lachnospiraceae bacterium]MBO4807713.1 accessory gene regulator B family protein [Lachnospiraceae bacterium]